jgi:hypothetical protein
MFREHKVKNGGEEQMSLWSTNVEEFACCACKGMGRIEELHPWLHPPPLPPPHPISLLIRLQMFHDDISLC